MIERDKYAYCAVSSRVRLARNLADFPFCGKPAREMNGEIITLVTRTLKPLGDFYLQLMSELDGAHAAYLKEKYVISPFLESNRINGAVIKNEDESISVMINEEDHLRLQCVTAGISLGEAYDNLSYISRKLSERMTFATDPEYGYITACMSNMGTGMRASVMLFLPALTDAGRMAALAEEMRELGLTVRGVFGEGSRPEGCLYQVSNEVTLGYSEKEIITMVGFAARKLCDMELSERNAAERDNPLAVEDECRRAYGILTNCRLLPFDEFADLFVKVSLGSYYGYYDVDPSFMNNLFVNMRSGILAYIENADTEEKRSEARARIVSNALKGYLNE
ncbi:MAG: ATP--guanido phosphotransferase [Clostridia bacterium]|nr:ATP--guanido phosphotransferase [Clostridia bacterium]